MQACGASATATSRLVEEHTLALVTRTGVQRAKTSLAYLNVS